MKNMGVATTEFWVWVVHRGCQEVMHQWGKWPLFISLPCGHAFHAECLIAHVAQHTSRTQAEYILDLQKQLSLLAGNSKVDLNGSVDNRSMTSTTPTDELQSRLDDAIASECPFCGDLMIREISLSFLLPEESNYADSWDITPPAGSQKILPMTMLVDFHIWVICVLSVVICVCIASTFLSLLVLGLLSRLAFHSLSVHFLKMFFKLIQESYKCQV